MPQFTVSRSISDEQLSQIITVESAGKVRAKAKTSSATGLGQFIDATWLAMITKHRPDLLRGRSRQEVLDLRFDPNIMIEILARFTEDNARGIGPGWKEGDLYLAHFAGLGTAKKLFNAAPQTSAESVFSPAAARANASIIRGKTAGEVRAWAARKMEAAKGYNWIEKLYTGKSDQEQPMPAETPVDPDAVGDPDVYEVQRDLDEMNYKPGGLDGKWGGMTAAAIAAFLNDRPGDIGIPSPTSSAQFRRILPALRREIDIAQGEGFTRPVAQVRRDASLETVAQSAPEVVPAQKGFLATVAASVVAALTAIWQGVLAIWNWFTGAGGDPGWLMTNLHKVPTGLWVFLAAALVAGAFAFIAFYYLKQTRDGIMQSVQSGERP